MPAVYLGVGSNIERERYIVAGLDALAGLFGELALSPVYDSAAIGFSGQPFLNLVVGVDTALSPGQLLSSLRHIEYEHGRPANASRFSPRQLDIDILTHGQLIGNIEGVGCRGRRYWRMPSCCARWQSWRRLRFTRWREKATSRCGKPTTRPRSRSPR